MARGLALPLVSGETPVRLRSVLHRVGHRLWTAWRWRRLARRTRRELEALSDRLLADVGIARADIPEIARRSAYAAVSAEEAEVRGAAAGPRRRMR